MKNTEIIQLMEKASNYRALKNELSIKSRMKADSILQEYDIVKNLPLNGMPMGYQLIQENFDKIYFWIDIEGNTSDKFDDMWDVYRDAMDRGYPWDIFSEKEIELIKDFDEHLNTKSVTRRIKNKYGMVIGKYRFQK